MGQTVDGSSILVRYTITGDANLDGTVGFIDLVRLAQNYGGTNNVWSTGDFTYDGYAKLHRTLWAGLQYLLFKNGPAASTLFETGGFGYADPAAKAAHWPDIQFHLGLGSGIE